MSLARENWSRTDLSVAAVSVALFAIWIYRVRDPHALADDDLYRVLVGIIDGARRGACLDSPLHYGKSFGFGYLAALYAIAKPSSLQFTQLFIGLINSVGFIAALLGSLCFWLSTRLVFWIANPIPHRHFILCLCGMSMLIGWLLTATIFSRPLNVYLAAFANVSDNQALAAVVGPVTAHYYPTKLLTRPGQGVIMSHIPIGSSWAYLRAVTAERARTDYFAQSLLTSCDAKTIVLSEKQNQIFSHLFEGGRSWNVKLYHWRGFLVLNAQGADKDFMAISLHEGWPRDVVAEVRADPTRNDYKVVRDPDTVSLYDKRSIPEYRQVHLGCQSLNAAAASAIHSSP